MRVIIENDIFKITFGIKEGIWACKRCVRVPTDHVSVVRHGIPKSRFLDVRTLGTLIPGVIKAGTYYTRDGKEFWFAPRGKQHYLTIELVEGAPFRRIVLGMDDISPVVERFAVQVLAPEQMNVFA